MVNHSSPAPAFTDGLGAKDLTLAQNGVEVTTRVYKYLDGPGVETVATPTELANMAASTVPNALTILTQNVDLSAVAPTQNWTGIPLVGTFEGNGFEVSNLHYSSGAFADFGFFLGLSSDARIQNFSLSGDVTCTIGCSAMAGFASSGSVLKNVSFDGALTAVPGGLKVGSLVGELLGVIDGCSVSGTLTSGVGMTGGVVGYSQLGGSIKNCRSTMSITATSPHSLYGGIVGLADDGEFENLEVNATIFGNSDVGGIMGQANNVVLKNASYTGNLSSVQSSLGGIIGTSQSGNTIRRCWSTGSVSGQSKVGGLVGEFLADSILEDSFSSAHVSTTTGTGGGLVGQISVAAAANLKRLYTTGNVTRVAGASGPTVGTNGATIPPSVYYLSTAACAGCTNSLGTSLSGAQLADPSTFAGWDLTTIWAPPNGGPPLLR